MVGKVRRNQGITLKPSRKKTTEYPKPWKRTTRLFQGHTIPHGLRLGILSNAGNHWFLHGWITPVLGHRYGGQCKKEPVLEEPDLVCLDWKVRRFKEKYLKPIMTFECFHAGTTIRIITSPRVGYDLCCLAMARWTPPEHQGEFPPSITLHSYQRSRCIRAHCGNATAAWCTP